MPRIRFYNRRFASRAPVRAPSLETTRRPPWGNPAGARLQDPSRARCFHRTFEPDAGPPLGHPASSGRAIDGAQTGFRPLGNPRWHSHESASALARDMTPCDGVGAIETAVALSADGRSRRGEPSDTSFTPGARTAGAALLPFAALGSIRARQCSRFSRARRCLPPEKSFARGLSRATRPPEHCSRWPTGAAAARVHRGSKKLSKTSTRPLGTPLSRELSWAACASTTSANECFHEHDDGPLEHPRPPNPWVGRLPID